MYSILYTFVNIEYILYKTIVRPWKPTFTELLTIESEVVSLEMI